MTKVTKAQTTVEVFFCFVLFLRVWPAHCAVDQLRNKQIGEGHFLLGAIYGEALSSTSLLHLVPLESSALVMENLFRFHETLISPIFGYFYQRLRGKVAEVAGCL